jgi:two-component system, chemotaxis family, chemotaxis protein CheY
MSLSVLLFSTEEVNVDTLKRGLITSGLRDIRVAGGQDDLTALLACGKKFDLAVIDVAGCFETGLAMLSVVRESFPEAECIAVSAMNDSDSAMECFKRGACDYMSMPFSKGALTSRMKKAAMYKKPAGARPRILIMEDDPISGKLMQKYLEPFGDCTLVVDGMDAVRLFEQALAEGGIYQLLLLDIMVPEIHGKDVLRRVREIEEQYGVPEKRRSRVIMTTALSDAANVVESFKSKCDSYLIKPIDRKVLIQEIAQLGFDTAAIGHT